MQYSSEGTCWEALRAASIRYGALFATANGRLVSSCPPIRLRTSSIGRRLERTLDLHEQLSAPKTPDAKTTLQRQIDATDRQIDQVVYELYGLTDDEIRIVEEARGGRA